MEILDVYDDNGKLTGKTVIRGLAHQLQTGEHVKTAHIVIMNFEKQFLIQKRSTTKKTRPSTWDLTCGAVSTGETSVFGAMREVNEEDGLKITESDLIFIGQTLSRTGVFQDIYFTRFDFRLEDCVRQIEEVDEIKLIEKSEFIDFVNSLNHRTKKYRQIIVDYVKKI